MLIFFIFRLNINFRKFEVNWEMIVGKLITFLWRSRMLFFFLIELYRGMDLNFISSGRII